MVVVVVVVVVVAPDAVYNQSDIVLWHKSC